MVQSKAKTVKEYLDELPADRRKEIAKVRSVVKKNLPKGYREAVGLRDDLLWYPARALSGHVQ